MSVQFPRCFIEFCVLLPTAACASTPNPHKVVDLRTMTDASASYEISFCSRPSPSGSIPGHAFVLYSMHPLKSERRVLALGFTTDAGAAKAALSYAGWMPGVHGFLSEEIYTSAKERCLVTLVDRKMFDVAWQIAHPLAKVPALESLRFMGEYRLGDTDCMDFMIRVATSLKSIAVPSRGATELPQAYMRRLVDSN